MVTTTTCMGSAETGLLVDTYHKLVASSIGELQCNTVRHFRKKKFFLNYTGPKELMHACTAGSRTPNLQPSTLPTEKGGVIYMEYTVL